MSLYNMIHGHSLFAPLYLAALEIDPERIDRFRDAELSRNGDEKVIRILCRTGGGNRESYPNKVLTSHSEYIRDEDDSFDSTYAYYYFRIPESIRAALDALEIPVEEDRNLKAKFDEALKHLGVARPVPPSE